MRSTGAVLIVAAVMVAAVPSTSEAQWRWLDKLSGPGPFAGVQSEWKLVCSYEEGADRTETVTLRNFVPIVSAPCLIHSFGEPDPAKREWAIGVATGLAASFANDLPYAGSPSTSERVVVNVPLELYGDFDLGGFFGRLKRLELGGFVGRHFFFGVSPLPFVDGSDVIPSTRKTVFGARVSLRTFYLRNADGAIGSVRLRSGVMFYPDGFTAEDFGALPGWSEKGSDPVFFFSVVFDFDKWK